MMTGQSYVSAWASGARHLGGHWVQCGKPASEGTSLDSLMQMDHVIRVGADGLVYDNAKGMYGPEDFYAPVDKDGQYTQDTERKIAEQLRSVGWEPQGGWSGQQGAKGDDYTMHDSEFIGGDLAEHILVTSGYWVACEVRTDEDEDSEETNNHAGWLFARHPHRVEKRDPLNRIVLGRVVSNAGLSCTVEWDDKTKTTERYDRMNLDWREAAE